MLTRVAFVVMFVAISGFTQEQGAVVLPAACRAQKITFEAKRDKTIHSPAQLKPGKALAYFIQDMGVTHCLGSCLATKIGMDGTCVGPTKITLFSLSVDPGEHHL